MAAFGQLDQKALAEAVMRRGEEMDFHDSAPHALSSELSLNEFDRELRMTADFSSSSSVQGIDTHSFAKRGVEPLAVVLGADAQKPLKGPAHTLGRPESAGGGYRLDQYI